MKKLFMAAAVAGVALSANAFAADSDVEISGHVNTGLGWQMYSTNGNSAAVGGLTAGGVTAANQAGGANRGSIGELSFTGAAGSKSQDFLFFVDEAEVDLKKSFGDNIRLRADLSFGQVTSGSMAGFTLEQAYATINIPAGNGIEFLVGRFDLPFGFESVERGENTLFSHGNIFKYLRPHSGTGIKFYYAFSDMFDMHVYAVNNLRDSLVNIGGGAHETAMPSFGTRLGTNWGEEGKKSTVGLSLAAGPEASSGGDKLGDWSMLGDIDWNVWLAENFALGGEAIYRTDNGASGAKKARYFGGQLNLMYAFTDTWDGTLRYSFVTDTNSTVSASTLTGAASLLNFAGGAGGKTQDHSMTLGFQYHLDDNAKVQFEGRYDMVKQPGATGHVYGGAVNFAYNF